MRYVLILLLLAGPVFAGSTWVPVEKVDYSPKITEVHKTCPICGECWPKRSPTIMKTLMACECCNWITASFECGTTGETFYDTYKECASLVWGKWEKDSVNVTVGHLDSLYCPPVTNPTIDSLLRRVEALEHKYSEIDYDKLLELWHRLEKMKDPIEPHIIVEDPR